MKKIIILLLLLLLVSVKVKSQTPMQDSIHTYDSVYAGITELNLNLNYRLINTTYYGLDGKQILDLLNRSGIYIRRREYERNIIKLDKIYILSE